MEYTYRVKGTAHGADFDEEFDTFGAAQAYASAFIDGDFEATVEVSKVEKPEPTELEKAWEVVRKAEAYAEAAREEAEAIRKREYDQRHQSQYEQLMALDEAEFYCYDAPTDTRPYVLPFGREYARFNPLDDADRENHEFGPTWTAGSTAIICKKDERTRPTRLIWSSGYDLRGESDKIGRRFRAKHDQTNASLGTYEIVGLAFFGPDGKLCRTVGDVPSIKFAQSTYK
jgi:hypothetical protein